MYQGNFFWDGEGFANSAENVHFSIEADGEAAVLRATLFDGEGNGQERDLNLGERIGNNDGNFQYSEFSAFGFVSASLTFCEIEFRSAQASTPQEGETSPAWRLTGARRRD